MFVLFRVTVTHKLSQMFLCKGQRCKLITWSSPKHWLQLLGCWINPHRSFTCDSFALTCTHSQTVGLCAQRGTHRTARRFISGAPAHQFTHSVWHVCISAAFEARGVCRVGTEVWTVRAAQQSSWNPEDDGDNRKRDYVVVGVGTVVVGLQSFRQRRPKREKVWQDVRG